MKFIDPWSIFKHFGGTMTAHIAMGYECFRQMRSLKNYGIALMGEKTYELC